MIGLLIYASKAFLLGIAMSIAPGPTGYGILHYALLKNKKIAYYWLSAMVCVDLFIITLLLSISQLIDLLSTYAFQIGSGLFLVFFSLCTFWSHKKAQQQLRFSNPFLISFLNPGVWIGCLIMLSFSSHSLGLRMFFWILYELGVICWYYFIINNVHRISETRFYFIKTAALSVIGAIGLYRLFEGVFRAMT
jgi:hypothetical protein